jgi:hypothetical protein
MDQASKCFHGEHAPVSIERHHVNEHAARGEGLRRFAQRIDRRVVPRTSIAHLRKHAIELGVRYLEACQHGGRSSVRGWSIVYCGHLRRMATGVSSIIARNNL